MLRAIGISLTQLFLIGVGKSTFIHTVKFGSPPAQRLDGPLPPLTLKNFGDDRTTNVELFDTKLRGNVESMLAAAPARVDAIVFMFNVEGTKRYKI